MKVTERFSEFRKKVNNKIALKTAMLTGAAATSMTTAAYAAGDPDSWISNSKTIAMNGISTVALVVVAFFAIDYLRKRKIIQFLGFVLLAAIVLVFVYSPEKAKDMGQSIFNAIVK